MPHLHLNRWDLAFLLVMSAQATAIAYLHQPRWKVLVFSLPLPFTLGSLSLGAPVDVTHAAGLLMLPLFIHAVRLLHYKLRLPAVAAITLTAIGYCAAGAVLAKVLPRTAAAFWIAVAAALATAVALALLSRHAPEPGHRSPLPVWIKVPIVAGIILALIMSKRVLSGFMPLFPIMGTITAYEARRSLRALCRQIPTVLLAFVPLVSACRLLQGRIGIGLALCVGWVGFLAVLLPLSWRMWFNAMANDED